MNRIIFSAALAILLMCAAMPGLAKVPADEAAKLKKELTPVGAERAGNKEGTIPAWTGGLTKIPDNVKYKALSGEPHPDPFADDKPLFTITAQNVDQYKDKLSPGILKMFKIYPETWKMHIYPTRRSAAYPKEVYEGSYKNALNAQIADEYGSVTNLGRGFPFPIPNSGAEAIVNFLLRPHGTKNITKTEGGGIVMGDGSIAKMAATVNFMYKFEDASAGKVDPKDYVFGQVVKMQIAGREGEFYLMKDPANYVDNDAIGYSYIPGTRRVRRNPNMFYDGYDASLGGIGTADDAYMWRGKIDRFDWTLKGKREMYIPYNNNAINLLPAWEPICAPYHPDPKYIRWELHRVWENVATLKKGARHVYGKRIYYMDEDSWLIGVKDLFDKRGNLWRMQFATGTQRYDIPVFRQAQYVFFDFTVDYYVIADVINGFPPEKYDKIPEDFFSVSNLRRLGRQ